MAQNRLLDLHLDALNPRTAGRALPSGKLSRRFYIMVLTACSLGFALSCIAFELFYDNPWPLYLALPVLTFLALYPLTKRYTRLCHYYLGLALALAPTCAWLAITGTLAIPPLVISAVVLVWTAGFDIIYATQDYQSDLATGTVSIPAKLGIAKSLLIARSTHVAAAVLLIVLGLLTPAFGALYFTGTAVAICLLILQHSMVRKDDLSKVNHAFFTVNGVISILMGMLGVIDVFL